MIQSQQNNNNLNLLDILSVISFVIGVANYEENISQSEVQDLVQQAVENIHTHLEMQDQKIDKIMEVLRIENN